MPNNRVMRRILLIVFVMFSMVPLCASGGNAALYLNEKAGNGTVYYVRIPVLASESKRREQFVFRAAAQMAMRNKIYVRYIVEGDRVASVLTEYDQKDTLGVSADLHVLEVLHCGSYYEALVEYRNKTQFRTVDVSVSRKPGKDGNPSWVAKPPKSSRYEVFVSTVTAPPDSAEGFFLSDEWAIGGLSTTVSKPVESGIFHKHEAVLSGAYIAARWYNAKTDTYYSLAVLPR